MEEPPKKQDKKTMTDTSGPSLFLSFGSAWQSGVAPHLHVQIHPEAVLKVPHKHPEATAVVSKGPGESEDDPGQANDGHGGH